jgi:hypothetical protein
VSTSDPAATPRNVIVARFAILGAILIVAQVEDLVTAERMLGRFGTVVEWGLLAGRAYLEYGVAGLIALKIALVAIVLGAAYLLVRVGHPRLMKMAVGLLIVGSLAGLVGAASNLRWVLRA